MTDKKPEDHFAAEHTQNHKSNQAGGESNQPPYAHIGRFITALAIFRIIVRFSHVRIKSLIPTHSNSFLNLLQDFLQPRILKWKLGPSF